MANFYRVKDGNWNLADSWATTSGGTTYHATTPTSSDDVFFDANTPTGTHTVNTTANTLSLDFTGFTGTLAGTSTLNIYGSLTLGSGMTRTYTGQLSFLGTTAASLTSNGKTIDRIHINNASKTLTLQDKLTLTKSFVVGGTFASIYLQAGTFDANSQDVELTGSESSIDGALTFYNLIKTGTAGKTDKLVIGANITVLGTLTVTGASAVNRILINNRNNVGTQRTITANAVSFSNVDFVDIKGAGAADWDLSGITGLSGDCGGNADITFTTGINCYYVGGGANGNWSDATKWKTTSGGATAARVPLPQDTAIIDANSFTGARTLTQDMPRIPSVNFTGSADVTWTFSVSCDFLGSINLTDLKKISDVQLWTFMGRGSHTITSAGISMAKPLTIDTPTGTLTLQDDFSTTGLFRIYRGTFDANNKNVSIGSLDSHNSETRTITMGSGTWEITGNTTHLWRTGIITNLTLNANTSTIKLTGALTANRTCDFGGLTLYNLWNATNGAFAVIFDNSNTFNDFKIDAGREVNFTAGTNTTVNTFTALGTSGSYIVIHSTTATNATLTKAGGGTIRVKYCDISYLTATPADTWLAYTTDGNVDSGNNTGWTFVGGDTRRRAAFIKFF